METCNNFNLEPMIFENADNKNINFEFKNVNILTVDLGIYPKRFT